MKKHIKLGYIQAYYTIYNIHIIKFVQKKLDKSWFLIQIISLQHRLSFSREVYSSYHILVASTTKEKEAFFFKTQINA